MKQISMYIESDFKGSPSSGTGRYIALLEYELKNGEPATKQYEGAVTNTTHNRLLIQALICGLSHLTMDCDVEIFVKSPYITETINQARYYEWRITSWTTRDKLIKNRDLWEQIIDYADRHLLSAIHQRATSYTNVLQLDIAKMNVDPIEDKTEE